MNDQNYDVPIERYAFRTNAVSPLNYNRLPPPAAFREMELAYRPEVDLSESAMSPIHMWLIVIGILVPAFASLLYWFTSVVPLVLERIYSVDGLAMVLGILAGLAGIALLIAFVFLVPPAGQLATAAILIPIGTSAAALALGAVSALTTLRVSLLSLAIWLLPATRRFLLRPYAGWLLADPRLTFAQRSADIIPKMPRNVVPALLIILAALGAASPRYLFPALIVLCLHIPPGQALKEVRRFVAVFLMPNHQAPAPGLWVPSLPFSVRLPALVLFAVIPCVAATLALYEYLGLGTTVLAPILGNLLVIALARPVITALAPMRESAEELAQKNGDRSWWECQVERLRDSHHVAASPDPHDKKAIIREAEHLFLGYEPSLHFPVLLSQRLLREHCYIVGRTGSGKTSIGVAQMLTQLIRGHRTETGWTPQSPIIILDLKGDPLLFHSAREEARKRGQEFRFFTLNGGKASYRFNPFRGFDSKLRSVPQLVQLILDSLSLNHGPGYGKGYFSQQSRYMLSQALTNSGKPDSFDGLYKTLDRMRRDDPRTYKDAFELLCTIEVLTHYWQLLSTKEQESNNPNEIIQMADALEERQVVYFYLEAALESISVREIAKLALFNLHAALLDRQAQGAEPRQTYLMIDEFQKAAGENFQTIIQQGRSAGMGVILVNQSLSDLKGDIDLRPTIQTNTGTKMFFSVTDPEEIKTLSFLSGVVLQTVGSEGQETMAPALSVNEILSISDHRRQLLLQVASGDGYTQFGSRPVAVETAWPFSEEEAERREKNTPWPEEPKQPKSSPAAAANAKKPPEKVESEVRARRRAQYSKAIKDME